MNAGAGLFFILSKGTGLLALGDRRLQIRLSHQRSQYSHLKSGFGKVIGPITRSAVVQY